MSIDYSADDYRQFFGMSTDAAETLCVSCTQMQTYYPWNIVGDLDISWQISQAMFLHFPML